MRILLLGATGRTGKLVLQKALEQGYFVHCLARKVERIPAQERLSVFEGDPSKKADLEEAMANCNAVISVLNISRQSDFPWARLRTPSTYLSDVIKVLIPIAEKQNIERIAICSAWGVAETKKNIPKWFKWFIENSNIGVAYQDHERQEAILDQSSIKWIIVRPVGLTNAKRQEEIKETLANTPKPSLLISRQSVASFLVESLTRPDLIGKKVVVSKQ